ncbi:hypothetical protein LHU53_15750 [Rhodoferax sp. U2-2l]|uniref:hypothetical protein n=1 Tax=Rhodoferax sp. U2-2l TaxID=2884000 RepID=UPI001D0AB959|nr:hypothetical protein [Rhodoferax sp. U2-2l]MCB8748355.1 hypothetical protein [Rhodoferax sp. U2-2l]
MKMLTRPLFWIPLLLLVWASCSFYAGDRYRNAAWLKKQSVQQDAAIKQLQAEQARGDALTTGLLTQQAQIDQLTQEAHRAISTHTTGRTCLDSAALRVLKRAPGITLVPAPTSGTAAAYGPATGVADDSSAAITADVFATDTQVADWGIDAGAQYEVCRTRLDKLIDWHAP